MVEITYQMVLSTLQTAGILVGISYYILTLRNQRARVQKVKKLNPDILGLSALMTTTMAMQREVIAALKEDRIREGVKVVVGGAPVTEKWATEIGEDACGYDADHAVKVALRLMEEARVDA